MMDLKEKVGQRFIFSSRLTQYNWIDALVIFFRCHYISLVLFFVNCKLTAQSSCHLLKAYIHRLFQKISRNPITKEQGNPYKVLLEQGSMTLLSTEHSGTAAGPRQVGRTAGELLCPCRGEQHLHLIGRSGHPTVDSQVANAWETTCICGENDKLLHNKVNSKEDLDTCIFYNCALGCHAEGRHY